MNNLANLIKLSEVPRLVEKYAGIAALPLALPKFELDNVSDFWRIWNEEHARVDRQHIDRGAVGKDPTKVSKSYTQWDGVALYEDEILLKNAAWVTKLSPALAESQPNYVKSIFETLPFVRTRSIRLWSANCTIPPHYDGNMPASLDGVLRFPTEIRIMLDDQNPTETFWLTPIAVSKPHSDVPQVDRRYVKLPIDTNTFAWNNEDFLHGADYNPQYRKILVVIKGWIDVDRLESLLDQSINKYSEYVIKS
jgi:hypothetical protein